jgi:hypothetical protein
MDTQIHDDIAAEAVRIVEAGATKGVKLRLLGGLAIRLRTPSTERPTFTRSYPDIDLASGTQASHQIETLIAGLGYIPDREFNMLNGTSRLLFFDPVHKRQVDIFVGQFDMCHQIPLAERLEIEPLTLPLAELLLTKLQIVQINEKDLRDICALLLDHPVGDTDGETINQRRIADLCAKDWGLWKTITLSLDKVAAYCLSLELEDPQKQQIAQRIDALRTALYDAPKSLRWKARATVGERMPWYNTPEEVQRG